MQKVENHTVIIIHEQVIMEYPTGERIVRQILLHRYKVLIERVKTLYPITPEQEAALIEHIIHIDWIDPSNL